MAHLKVSRVCSNTASAMMNPCQSSHAHKRYVMSLCPLVRMTSRRAAWYDLVDMLLTCDLAYLQKTPMCFWLQSRPFGVALLLAGWDTDGPTL